MYIHEKSDWPKLTWNSNTINPLLIEVRHAQGHLLGRMQTLGFDLRTQASLQVLTEDTLRTSEIEGEHLDTAQVRSSIAKRLGIPQGGYLPADGKVDGIVDMLLDATQHAEQPLTASRLHAWHTLLFEKQTNSLQDITIGAWRTHTMQVVSGPYGHETIHYEAPSPEKLSHEMDAFLKWFNNTPQEDPVIKSAIAHFWFVTIHPFDDGNGRIARAVADMVLARTEGSQRFYSISAQIQKERKSYYTILEQCQKSDLDITPWIEWYLYCLKNALISSENLLEKTLVKSRFWKEHTGKSFNLRQCKMIQLLLEDFQGHLTSSKWAKITKCSQDTALRDIHSLLELQVLTCSNSGGRSTHYLLNI